MVENENEEARIMEENNVFNNNVSGSHHNPELNYNEQNAFNKWDVI